MRNVCTLTDSYKFGHWNMYPEGTETVYSYFEPRRGAKFNATTFFGLQYLLKRNFLGRVVTQEKIDAAEPLVNAHMGMPMFNRKGWEHILNDCDGKLPVRICAVPEGLSVPTDNVLMTVENTTGKDSRWLTNSLETVLTHVWSSSTVATLSREVKILFTHYLNLTADGDFPGIDFMLHDFGFRGASSVESAGIEGAGHLLNFSGTDTFRAIEVAMEYYASGMCAYSVPATEHSVMTSRGVEGEIDVVKELLSKYPTGILSIVIDSYDYEAFITEIASHLKDRILARDGKTVFRPDSGDPVTTTLRVFELLDGVFGHTVNSKGYKVLNEKVGVLWGDGIDYIGIRNILYALRVAGWSAQNIVFGMGGGLLQKINRDDQRFAFKCSAQLQNGEWVDIFKKPKDISKMSKRGRLYLYKSDSNYKTTNVKDPERENILVPVFENGELLCDWTFGEVRANAAL